MPVPAARLTVVSDAVMLPATVVEALLAKSIVMTSYPMVQVKLN